MSKSSKATHGSAAAAGNSPKFKNMKPVQKVMHLGKVCMFFLTLGFAYPNIFIE